MPTLPFGNSACADMTGAEVPDDTSMGAMAWAITTRMTWRRRRNSCNKRNPGILASPEARGDVSNSESIRAASMNVDVLLPLPEPCAAGRAGSVWLWMHSTHTQAGCRRYLDTTHRDAYSRSHAGVALPRSPRCHLGTAAAIGAPATTKGGRGRPLSSHVGTGAYLPSRCSMAARSSPSSLRVASMRWREKSLMSRSCTMA